MECYFFSLLREKISIIIYVNNFIGSHNIEIEMETKNEEETDQIIKSFRDKFFENIKNYTILTVKKEHKLKFVPF